MLRLIHKIWKIFWEVVLSIIAVVIILIGVAIGLLQLGATKGIIGNKIENNFNNSHRGRLSIGNIKGFLPFNVELQNVALTFSPDSTSADTLISVIDARIKLDLWSLLHDKLSVQSFRMAHPSVYLLSNGNGGYTLSAALENPKAPANKKAKPDKKKGGSILPKIAITAPKIVIQNGTFYAQKLTGLSGNIHLPQPLLISNINTQLFINLTSENRFINIDRFKADIHHIKAGSIALSGQVFNNNQALEFNGFNLQLGSSDLQLDGKINGIDITKTNIQKQLAGARLDLKLHSGRLLFTELNDVLPGLPDIDQPLSFTTQLTGRENALNLQEFKAAVGKSFLQINGEVTGLFKKNRLEYDLHIDTLNISNQDMKMLTNFIGSNRYASLKYLSMSGNIQEASDTVSAHLSGTSGLGSLAIQAKGAAVSPYSFNGSLTARHLNVAPFLSGDIDSTALNFSAHIVGKRLSLDSLSRGSLQLRVRAHHSFMNAVEVGHLHLLAALHNGRLRTRYSYRYKGQKINGMGRANFNQKEPSMSLKGKLVDVNLPDYVAVSSIDSTSLNTTYQLNLHGIHLENMYGKAELGIEKSRINGQPIKAHQVKLQLTSPKLSQNSLELDSPFFNLHIKGNIEPVNVLHEMAYWGAYFKNHLNNEIFLDSTVQILHPPVSGLQPLQLDGHFTAKNMTLLQKFFPGFFSISSNTTARFKLNADSTNLQFSSRIISDSLRINKMQLNGAETHINGRFNHQKSLKQSGRLTISAAVQKFNSTFIKMDSLNVQFRYRRDSLFYTQKVGKFSNSSRFDVKAHSTLSKNNIKATIDNFYLGNKNYAWQTSGTPKIVYNRGKKVQFHSFKFHNGNGYFAVKGTMSPFSTDSLQYIVHNVNLTSISKLLKGKFNFSGRLNGEFQTRSLTREPSFQGKLAADDLALDGRLVGDVTLSSKLNKKKKRYDTSLRILTDSTKYQAYLKKNQDIGQNILLKGYFVPAGLRNNQNTLLHFNADFKQMDMWVFQLLLPNIFRKVNGAAHGTGLFTGTLQKPVFKLHINLNNVNVQTDLLRANYYLSGLLTFSNNKKGLVIHQVHVKDNDGGTGTVSGNIDMNDFQPKKYIHLNLKMNKLKFVNNHFSLGVPFFGNIAATGDFHLDGPTTGLRLTSPHDIQIAKNSTFGYPLTNQTPLNANSNFIKFVDSLKNPARHLISNRPPKKSEKNAYISRKRNLTFSERFNIDLQFVAPKPIHFRIIFDPVTNEHIAAQGDGRLRLIMHDGNTQIFGHFSISGGSYQFVTAGIFSRKFNISPGGSVIWEGQPNNARINMKAYYTARPSVASLFNANTKNQAGAKNAGLSQQIPVKMIIHITGPLQHMQKKIHFELPNTFNLRSNSQITYILNRINSNRQESFKQAASILLTGNFLPTGATSNQSGALAGSLTRSSTYISPILSNQIISPFVSHQFNSLFNNNMAHFNFDFRFNQFNQIDLGVSLSLFNDKLVLRREGYLAGGYLDVTGRNRVGNLGATYHINNNLSIMAFHRQDLLLGRTVPNLQSDISPNISPLVNGIGLNAHVKFNTWQQLIHKVRNFFRRLFGKKEINFKKRKQKRLSKKKHNRGSTNKE